MGYGQSTFWQWLELAQLVPRPLYTGCAVAGTATQATRYYYGTSRAFGVKALPLLQSAGVPLQLNLPTDLTVVYLPPPTAPSI